MKEVQKLLSDNYERIENVSHSVRLFKESDFTSSIISEDGSSEISPKIGVPVSYQLLKENCVVHRVRIKTPEMGEHNLQLQIKMGHMVKHVYPFHLAVGAEDLYVRTVQPSRPNDVDNEGNPSPERQLLIGNVKIYTSMQPITTNVRFYASPTQPL